MSDLVKSVTLKIRGDDGDTEAKLDRISEKADELARKHPELSVRIKTAEATAKIAAIREELKHFGDETDKLKEKAGSRGLIGRLLFGAEEGAEGGGGGKGLIGVLTSLGEGGLTSPLGIGAIVAAVSVLLPELTGLVAGFAAAGAGIGAFGLLALPAIDKVKGALKDTSAQLAKLSPDERGAVLGIRSLKDEFMKMSNAFQPDAFKVFDQGLKIANELLPHLKPFADTAATALDGLLKHVAKFADSKGFTSWLAQFHKLEGPSLNAIGVGFGHIATSVGKLLTTMSKKDVVNAINIAFSILDGTIIGLTATVKFLMHAWDLATTYFDDFVSPAFDRLRHEAAHLGDDLGTLAGKVSAFVSRGARDFANWNSDADRAVSRAESFFAALPGKVGSALSSLAGKLLSIGRNAVLGLVHGIESEFGAVEGAVSHLAGLIPSALSHILSIFSPSRVTYWHGQMIGQGLIDGMDSMNGKVASAAGRMGLAAGLGGRGGYGAAGAGGGDIVLHLNVNERQLMEWIHTGLLTIKRNHGQKIDTSKGLGLA